MQWGDKQGERGEEEVKRKRREEERDKGKSEKKRLISGRAISILNIFLFPDATIKKDKEMKEKGKIKEIVWNVQVRANAPCPKQ